jgi:hypothetical protein
MATQARLALHWADFGEEERVKHTQIDLSKNARTCGYRGRSLTGIAGSRIKYMQSNNKTL